MRYCFSMVSAQVLDEALAQLRSDPRHPVRVRLDDLTVEMRAVEGPSSGVSAADSFDSIGPWEGETMDEILEMLAAARQGGGRRGVTSL
jgi:hypothetical protein